MEKFFTKHNLIVLGLLLAGFLTRVFLFFYFTGHDRSFFFDDDSSGYLQLAENMRQGHGFSWEESPPFEPNSFRTLGYPFFLLLARTVFGGYEAALILQSFLVCLTAYVIFLIAKKLGHNLIGYWSAAIFLFSPFSLMVSIRFLTQPLFTFFLTLAVLFWFNFLESQKTKYFIWVSLLLPLLAIIRPIAIYLYLPFLVSLALTYKDKIFVSRIIRNVLLVIFIFFAGLSPWLWRNYKTFGHFALSSITPYQLYFYDTPAVYARSHKVSYNEARKFLESDIKKYANTKSFDDYMSFENNTVLKERALNYLLESPKNLLIARVALAIKFFVRDGVRYWLEYFKPSAGFSKLLVLAERVWLGILFLGLAMFVFSKKEKQHFQPSWFLVFVIIYFAVLTGAVASAGLRFPVEPLTILLGLIGWRLIFTHSSDFSK